MNLDKSYQFCSRYPVFFVTLYICEISLLLLRHMISIFQNSKTLEMIVRGPQGKLEINNHYVQKHQATTLLQINNNKVWYNANTMNTFSKYVSINMDIFGSSYVCKIDIIV